MDQKSPTHLKGKRPMVQILELFHIWCNRIVITIIFKTLRSLEVKCSHFDDSTWAFHPFMLYVRSFKPWVRFLVKWSFKSCSQVDEQFCNCPLYKHKLLTSCIAILWGFFWLFVLLFCFVLFVFAFCLLFISFKIFKNNSNLNSFSQSGYKERTNVETVLNPWHHSVPDIFGFSF